MATQRYISTSFWDDSWVQTIAPIDKLLYLYFMTNPLTNIAGVYKITDRRISFDTGIDIKNIEKIMNSFKVYKKIYRIGEWVAIPAWPKHQKWEARTKIKLGIISELNDLPLDIFCSLSSIGYCFDLSLVKKTSDASHAIPYDKISEDIESYTYVRNYSDLDSDLDIDIDSDLDTKVKSADEPHRAIFKAPSQEEVEAYCKERGNSVIAAQFCDFYESKGWMVGKSKMKSWRAAIRTWERNGYSQGGAKKPGTLDNRPDAWSEEEIAQNREAIEAMEAPTDEELAELEEIKKRASGTVAGRAIIGMLGRQ